MAAAPNEIGHALVVGQRCSDCAFAVKPGAFGAPQAFLELVATVNETMAALKIGRAKTYELLNSGALESYLEGSSRKVTWRSIEAYIERRLAAEAARRGRAA